MDKLDEQSLRRPDFQGGRPVVLADGQEWSIPTPILELSPDLDEDGALRVVPRSSFGDEFQALIDAVSEAPTYGQEALALFRLAMDLLGRNYNLTMDHYRELLRYRVGTEDGAGSLQEVFDVAIGKAPKPSPAG